MALVLETLAITSSTAYIIITWSGGRVNYIPKSNLSIVFNDDNPTSQKVILTWPSGSNKQSFDTVRLGYLQISSPSLANDAALIALLVGYADTAASVSASGGAGGGSIVYANAAGDFTATPGAGAKTVTLAGLKFALGYLNLIGGSIKKLVTAGGEPETLFSGSESIVIAGNVITLADADDFIGTETVYVTLIGPDKWYDLAQDVAKFKNMTPEWAHYTDIEHIVDDSDATIDQHYSDPILSEGYRNIGFHFTGSSSTAGVTFKIWGTLNPNAATPADLAAAPSSDWFDLSTDIIGAANTVINGASEIYWVNTPFMPHKYLIQYDPDHATNETDVFIRKY